MKIFKSVLIMLVIILNMASGVYAKEDTKESELDLTPNVRSAILLERDTGKVLYNKSENKKLPPASMTKIMSLILIMEELEKGDIDLTDEVKTSEYASSMGGSQIFLEAGEKMTVEEMLYGVAVASANDACVALAEKTYGSEQAFVAKMNEKVKEMGLKNTHFTNVTGLPAKDHYSSAYDMAIMARELLKYEQITKFTGTYEKYLRENSDKKFWLVNTNRLIKSYDGMDGLKTGFTAESKYCLTATASRDEMRLIAVVFGAESPKERNEQITKVMDYGFTHYRTIKQFNKDEKLTFVPVEKGTKRKVQVVVADHVTLLLKKSDNPKEIKPEIKISSKVDAPVKKGDKLGVIRIKNGKETLSEVDIVASETLNEASFFDLLGRSLSSFLQIRSTNN